MILFLAIIFGCFIGFAVGFAVTAFLLSRSNDIGNSKGTAEDFSDTPIRMLDARNKISKSPF